MAGRQVVSPPVVSTSGRVAECYVTSGTGCGLRRLDARGCGIEAAE